MKLVRKNVKDGYMISITVRVEGEYEKKGYRAIPGLQKCPHCGKPVNPKDEDMLLTIPAPLAPAIPGAALELGSAITRCSSCGEEVRDHDQCDLMSFPEVMTYLTSLRKAAAAKLAKAKKGGSRGGKAK